jgi:hypothetical protein
MQLVDDTCPAHRRVVRRGAGVANPQFFTRRQGRCSPTVFIPGPRTAYTLGDPVPDAMFVKGTRQAEPPRQASDPVRRVFIEAEDGAREVIGWQTADGADCEPLTLGDGHSRCVGFGGALAPLTYADATCSQPAVFDSLCDPLHPFLALEPDAGSCSASFTVRAVGPRLDTIFTRQGTSCNAQPAGDIGMLYAAGAPMAPETFPPVDQVLEEASGPLRRRLEVAPGGLTIEQGWATADGKGCRPAPFGEELRCAPDGPELGNDFADQGCTQPLWHTFSPDPCPPPFALTVDDSACPAHTRVYAVGAHFRGPTFTRAPDPANPPQPRCQPRPATGGPDLFYSTSAVPDASLPLLQGPPGSESSDRTRPRQSWY